MRTLDESNEREGTSIHAFAKKAIAMQESALLVFFVFVSVLVQFLGGRIHFRC